MRGAELFIIFVGIVAVLLIANYVLVTRQEANEAEKPKRKRKNDEAPIIPLGTIDELERLTELYTAGALTEDEFNRLKAQVIDAPYVPDNDLRERVEELLLERKKIEAIKLYREATGLGLKESKDVIDEIEREQNLAGKF